MAVVSKRLQKRIDQLIADAKATGEIRPGEPFTVRLIHRRDCISNRDKGDCDCNPTVEIVKSSVPGIARGIGGKK